MAGADDDLHAMVCSIVDELEAAVSGSLYEVDGDYVVIDDLDEWKEERYGKMAEEFRKEHPEDSFDPEESGFDTYVEWMEDEIGVAEDVDEPEQASLCEYISERSLGDVRFEVTSDKTLCGDKVLFCYGGPNIWIADDEVRGYWGSSTVEMPLDSDTRSELWDWFENQWEGIK